VGAARTQTIDAATMLLLILQFFIFLFLSQRQILRHLFTTQPSPHFGPAVAGRRTKNKTSFCQ
jgi:hypothetical protein